MCEARRRRRRASRGSVTGQFAYLDEDLTGYENLLTLGRPHGLSRAAGKKRADDLLDAFDLTGAADRPAGDYSGGMRRRLDMGAGLIVTPDLMFLDEPTTGLDPRSRNQMWELVRRVAVAGTTSREADHLAEWIAVIDNGRIVAEGTSDQLKSRIGSGSLHLRLIDAEQRPQALQILAGALQGTGQPAAARSPCPRCSPARPTRRTQAGWWDGP
ncbi:ATP-binding cassette domain-containing protein [Streptomyces sp. NPDC005485]|uniref:ATP-binding cassette domain-containing protein n=1 Tax=Streptomyces sp. NPDC005485 TaxID=3155591 RepID=UPI0033A08646